MLSNLLTPERVKVPLESQTKDEVLRELVQLAMPAAEAAALERMVSAVLEREMVLSTGIGSGIAIPHGRTSEVGSLILAAGVAPVPIDFDALDGRPVSLFFMRRMPKNFSSSSLVRRSSERRTD